MTGAVESDSFDRLVLREGMHWRQVVVLRAYAKYMRQMGNTNSYGFLADTLLANPDVTRGLIALFEATLRSRRSATPSAGSGKSRSSPDWTQRSSRSRPSTPTGCCAPS